MKLLTSARMLLLIVAVSVTWAADAADKLRVGMINVTSYNGWIAKDQGFFDKEGLDVELVRFGGGPQVNQALLAGSLEFGYTGFGPAIFAAAQGLPFLMVANGAYSDTENAANAIIVGGESPYRSIKDLDGKRVAVHARGTIEHLVADIAANNAGIAIKLVELPFEHQELALRRGDIDAVSAHTPNVEWMTLKGHRVLQRIPGGSLPYFQIANLTVRRDYAEKNPDIVVRMVKAFIRTNRWIMDNQAKAKEIVVQKRYLNYPEELRPHVLNLKWQRNGMPMLDSQYYFANQMRKIGSIEKVPNLEQYFVTNYIEKALADIGRVPDPDFERAVRQRFPN